VVAIRTIKGKGIEPVSRKKVIHSKRWFTDVHAFPIIRCH